MNGTDTVRRVCDAFLARDFETFHKLWVDDCSVVDVALGTTKRGRAELTGICNGIVAAFPDIRYEDVVIFSDGDRAALKQVTRATHTGEFDGFPPTGLEIVWPSCSIFRLTPDGGQVIEEVFYYDRGSLVAQLQRESAVA
jgi:steroid delta-isomerase-like uncharacterized protein